jgi:hypothetical protein
MTRFGISYVSHIGHICLPESLLIELFSRGLTPDHPDIFREAGHNCSFSGSDFSRFDVLVQAEEVLGVVLLLDGH